MDVPEKVAGLNWRDAQKLLKDLLDSEQKMRWEDGVPHIEVRRITSRFIESTLRVSSEQASLIQEGLVNEGWIRANEFTPTRRGMGLVHHVERPKLPRLAAEAIVDDVVNWAERSNTDAGARVRVRSIRLFGSLEREAAEVSDIDLFVEFSTMELGLDVQPEDISREDELLEELAGISEYISPASEMDRLIMDDVPSRQVFPRQTTVRS